MTELEIKAILECTKVGKTVKQSLLNLGKKRDKEYQKVENKDYDKKIKELEVCIVEAQKNQEETYKKQLHGNSEQKSTSYKRALWISKVDSPTSLRNLKKIFTTYADVPNKSITTDINNKLSVVGMQLSTLLQICSHVFFWK